MTLLCVLMFVYWTLYALMGMDMTGLPILCELVNAFLALVSAIGLLRRHILAVPLTSNLYSRDVGVWSLGRRQHGARTRARFHIAIWSHC